MSLIVGAMIATLLSYRYGTFSALGEKWYFVPTGLYLLGMVVVANAMNPEND